MGDNSVCHWYSHQILLGKSLGVVQEEMLYVKSHKDKISSCTTPRDWPSNVWWLYQWQTELSPLCCDFLHIECLLVLHQESQCKGDNSVCHIYSHQTLLGKSLDAVQEEIVYVKGHKVSETIQFVTYTVILPCDFLHVKFFLVLHLETC
jgi:hypothetical protein